MESIAQGGGDAAVGPGQLTFDAGVTGVIELAEQLVQTAGGLGEIALFGEPEQVIGGL